MYHSMRSIEIYRTAQEESVDSCDQCVLRRSNAIRRKGRCVIITKGTAIKRAQKARQNFDKCIDRCGLPPDVPVDQAEVSYG